MSNQLHQIDHIVQLMLENRSFDHMLGFLYTDANPPNQSPLGHPYEGLKGTETNLDSAGNPVTVFRITNDLPHPYLMPGADPGEGFQATNLQLFSADPVPTGTKATNSGFVTNFQSAIAYDLSKHYSDSLPGTQPSDIMGMYTPEMLPILSGLARGFAVCDHWFASVPSETMPNRAFACAGTSLGHLTDNPKYFNTPSIFGLLTKAKLDWAVYGYTAAPYTKTDFPDTKTASAAHFGLFADFQHRAAAGTLPPYTFLEPSWSSTGNSQHPNYDVALGEKLIRDVYLALRNGPGWKNTLLVITYDEHGGNYDHVAPPTNAVPPDHIRGDTENFDFTRFGVRVPAVLVSPLIAAGTVFRAATGTIDHTSVLKTIEQRWKLKPLTARDAAAPSLGDVLTLEAPRTDDPLAGIQPPSPGQPVPNANRPSKIQSLQAERVSHLPVPNEFGTFDHTPPDLTTSTKMSEYIRDRTAAWEEHHTILRRRGLATDGSPVPEEPPAL